MKNLQQFEAGYLLHNLLTLVGSVGFLHGLTVSLQITFLGLVFLIALVLLRKLFQMREILKEKYTLLELTPPAFTEKESYTTQQLFQLIHALGSQRSFLDRLLGYTPSASLEITSTMDLGIRYLVRIPAKEANTLKKSLLSYMPQLIVKIADEYLHSEQLGSQAKVMEFKLSHHFAFPLKKHELLEKHDPIAYITGMMTKLSPGELVSLQIVLTPTKSGEARRLSNVILYNGNLLEDLNRHSGLLSSFFATAIKVLYNLYSIPFLAISDIRTQGSTSFSRTSQLQGDRNKTLYEEEVIAAVHEKVNQPFFETTMRLLLVVNDGLSRSERTQGFLSSLATFSTHGKQSIIPVRHPKFLRNYVQSAFLKRLPGIFQHSLLSVSEISAIYHFPFTSITQTEDIVKVHSKELPAPLALKKANRLDISFAKNTYGGTTTMIGLTEEERRRHMYILGATGTGKSTLLLSMINQDIQNGKGVCVIDPHGDLAEKILPLIPQERLKDVIYFNPDDIGHPIGINLLELSSGLSDEDAVREKEFITESIISLFHKIYSDKYSGPRMEYILRNTIHTAFTVPGRTLFTVYKLLINTPFRKQVTAGLTDENLKDFWKYEFSKAGDYQKVKMISPITNKIGRFLFSPTAKRILEQEKSTINFDDIMDSGKILICNLSKGRIGEDNSEVFGIVLMTKIQLAALKRARVSIENRRDFYLYVDEFQNFATPAFAQILSEARKYRLSAILAHQTTSQLEDKSLVNVTLANTGTVICFRTANPEDEQLILPQFYPYVQQGEIGSLPSYHFYIKINAINPEEPFSGETMPVEANENKEMINEVIRSSRAKYTKEYSSSTPTVTLAVASRPSKKLGKDMHPEANKSYQLKMPVVSPR